MESQVFKLFLLDQNNEKIQEIEKKIYMDDNIENMKYKLCSLLDDPNQYNYSFFYKQEVDEDDLRNIFKKYVKGKDEITTNPLKISCLNLEIPMQEQTSIDENEFVELQAKIMNCSLDHNLDIFKAFGNPLFYKSFLNVDDRKVKVYNHKQLVFQLPKMESNIIYAIHNNVYKQSDSYNENYEKIHYPNLNKTNNLKEKYDSYNNHIDNHNRFYQENKVENKIALNMDIHEIHFIHKPTSDFIFPQDIFFKKLHSNKEYPLIMYKQDKNLEPAFRLYTPFLDLKGKQKPFFENKKLLKLCSQLKHKENLGLYVYKKDVESKNINIFVGINETGHIQVYVKNMNMDIKKLQTFCVDVINTKTIYET